MFQITLGTCSSVHNGGRLHLWSVLADSVKSQKSGHVEMVKSVLNSRYRLGCRMTSASNVDVNWMRILGNDDKVSAT